MAFVPRGLGWKKDKPKQPGDKPDFSARPKLGAAPPPKTATCRPYITSILNQGGLGSCTTNATAQAVRASLVRQGVKGAELPSRLFLYYLARAYDHDTYNDDGTFLRHVCQAAVKFGLPRESFWPYTDVSVGDDAPFRRMPPFNAFSKAFDQHTGASYHRIDTTGAARLDDIRRAIAAGYCVVFGTLVSTDFASGRLGSGPIPLPTNKPIAGGHALTIAEYDETSFGIVNSWGDDWGDKGWCKFSPDYLSWSESDDFWIISLVPNFSDGNVVAVNEDATTNKIG